MQLNLVAIFQICDIIIIEKEIIILGQIDKLIEKLKARPKTYLYSDAELLLKHFKFDKSNKGKTSGSRVIFTSDDHGSVMLHKPHPQKELKSYQVKQLADFLEQEGLI